MNSSAKDIVFLFDLDGVLIDSEKEYTKIWDEIDRRFVSGVKDLSLVIKGMTLDEIISTYFPDEKRGADVRKTLHELESEMKYEWMEGAKELLSKLHQKHIPVVLVTSSDRKKMAHLHEELPEAEYFFTYIITGDLVSRSKPDPEGYLKGMKLTGIHPSKSVVFEDSLQGVKAGRNSGAYVIGVSGTLSKETIAPYSNRVIDSLKDIDLNELVTLLRNRE